MLGGSRRSKDTLINEEINHNKKNETSLRILQDPCSIYKSFFCVCGSPSIFSPAHLDIRSTGFHKIVVDTYAGQDI